MNPLALGEAQILAERERDRMLSAIKQDVSDLQRIVERDCCQWCAKCCEDVGKLIDRMAATGERTR